MSDDMRQELRFTDSYCSKISIEIPKEADAPDNLTLVLKSVLTPDIASALGVSYIYISETTVPEDGFRDIHLQAKLKDVELKLKSSGGELDTFYPELVSKFYVFRIGDARLGVRLEAETTGNFNDFLDFFRQNRTDGFEFIIRSRQGDLFEGGVRVDMTGDEQATAAEGGEQPVKRGRGRPRKNPAPEPVTVN